MSYWQPLSIPPGATPLEAFNLAASRADGSEGILLSWSPHNGWGGIVLVRDRPGETDDSRPVVLARFKDTIVVSAPLTSGPVVLN